jgi:epidermal growth factor receptor substrate 15
MVRRLAVHPKLNYTPDERSLFGQLFRDCDPEGTGVVTGEAAVKLFQKTKVSEQILGEVREVLFLRPILT